MMTRSTASMMSFLALITLFPERPAAAQSDASRTKVCFNPHPLPRCSRIVVFEHTIAAGLVRGEHFAQQVVTPPGGSAFAVSQRAVDFPSYAQLSLGLLVNRDSSHAIGAVVSGGVGEGTTSRFSIEAMRRWWLPGGNTFDASAGPLVHEVTAFGPPTTTAFDVPSVVKAYGMTANAALGYHGHVAAVVGLDASHGAGRTGIGVHGGVKFGSYTAVGTTTLSLLLAALAAAALSNLD